MIFVAEDMLEKARAASGLISLRQAAIRMEMKRVQDQIDELERIRMASIENAGNAARNKMVGTATRRTNEAADYAILKQVYVDVLANLNKLLKTSN